MIIKKNRLFDNLDLAVQELEEYLKLIYLLPEELRYECVLVNGDVVCDKIHIDTSNSVKTPSYSIGDFMAEYSSIIVNIDKFKLRLTPVQKYKIKRKGFGCYLRNYSGKIYIKIEFIDEKLEDILQ